MATNSPAIRTAAETARTGDNKPSLAEVIRTAIEQQTPQMAAVLPNDLDPARFARLVLTAVKATPDLGQCFSTPQGKTSIMLAVMQLAAIGIEPNTLTRDAWLLPRKNNSVMEAVPTLSYRGMVKLARRSSQVLDVHADVVRVGDEFEYERGIRDVLRHKPGENEGDKMEDITHAWAMVKLANGGVSFLVMTRKQLEKRRAMSDSWKSEKGRPYSPWTKWTAEQCQKTVLRRLLDTSGLLEAEVQTAYMMDERPMILDTTADEPAIAALPMGDDEDVIDVAAITDE